jgi:hypothetical protein
MFFLPLGSATQRIRIRTKAKCHGSGTLVLKLPVEELRVAFVRVGDSVADFALSAIFLRKFIFSAYFLLTFESTFTHFLTRLLMGTRGSAPFMYT